MIMIKFADQSERNLTGQNGFLVAQILSRDMKTKTKNESQPIANHKK